MLPQLGITSKKSRKKKD